MFNSLAECLDHIDANYPHGVIRSSASPLDREGSEESFVAEVPQYLFRGESGDYSTTLPSIDRLLLNFQFPVRALEDVLRARLTARQWLMEKGRVHPFATEGYCQHYGLPTEFVDVTFDLRVAASFASDLDPGAVGVLGIFPTDVLLAETCTVVDLTGMLFGERPRRQRLRPIRSAPPHFQEFGVCGGTSDHLAALPVHRGRPGEVSSGPATLGCAQRSDGRPDSTVPERPG